MTNSQKSFYKSNEFKTGLAILILGGIGTLGYDLYKQKSLLTTMENILSTLKNYLLATLMFKISLGWVLLAIIVILLALSIMVKFQSKTIPLYKNYTTDRLKKWKWSWDYSEYYGKVSIINLVPHCPNCDTVMHYSETSRYSRCPRCEKVFLSDSIENIHDVEALIRDNVNRNNLLNP